MRFGRLSATSIVFLSLVMLQASLIGASAQRPYQWMTTVEMLVPAVAETPSGYIGVASKLVVRVAYPGSGTVYFSADPLTELDTQAAARIAAIVAATLAGKNFYMYDYFVHLEANSTIVGGPSASGAMAVAILAALRGKTIPQNFSMTGMIDPDTTLGPVGGIPQKLEAMAEKGVKVFVVPVGQSIALDLNTGRYVNVTALGENLGVKVIEAKTVLEAYLIATHDEELAEKTKSLRKISIDIYEALPGLKDDLEKTITMFESYAESNITCAKSLVNNAGPSIQRLAKRLIEDANTLLKEANALHKKGFIYSAASRAFGASIDATFACLLLKAFSSQNPEQLLINETTTLLSLSRSLLTGANNLISKFITGNRITDVGLQVLIATENRVAEARETISSANQYLSAARSSLGFNRVDALISALHDAVYAYHRSLTALQWANMLSLQGAGQPISNDRLISLARTYYYIASSAATYLQALASSIGVPTQPPEALAKAEELLRSTRGENLTASINVLSLSVTALAETTTSLYQLFMQQNVEKMLMASRDALRLLIGIAYKGGTIPVLPLLYAEYSEIQQDMAIRIALNMQASSYALLLAILSEHRGKLPTTTTSPSTLVITKTKTITSIIEKTINITKTTTITLSSTKTITTTEIKTTTIETRPSIAEYAQLATISIIIGVAIGYIIGRTRPSSL
ncbi:CGP-CTERM sorting domain-containing protein [Pyrofollis japonicus]|uniref:S16 family serine protease n=1 Tax=Pyrofollis japonicus TaxID=3060460 RepID=UPI00295BF365|nr:S16 family serine protease [Pyrofollis japonicus]BEP18529.1 CGP-CTERM sorting domain-containing protein [Pyrofollis japonicus]